MLLHAIFYLSRGFPLFGVPHEVSKAVVALILGVTFRTAL
jgi:hypothetical protein